MSKETRTVTLDEENDAFLAEQDNASALVNDLVTQYREGGDRGTVALELQKDQKKRKLDTHQRMVNNLQNDIAEIETLIREFKREESAELREARQALEHVPNDPENEAVKNWAKKLGKTPDELLSELE